MADRKKIVMKEIALWRKRFNDSKKVMSGVYKDVKKDASRLYKDVYKQAVK